MNGLWAAFPDLSFEIASKGLAGENLVAAQWIMRGTNTGSMMGLPPTGKSVTVSGADFIRVAGGKIQTVDGYFDSRAVPEQLGLQVLVQPEGDRTICVRQCEQGFERQEHQARSVQHHGSRKPLTRGNSGRGAALRPASSAR